MLPVAMSLLYSGLIHYSMQYQFYKSVLAYDLFPNPFDKVLATLFPSFEIAIAIGLFTRCLQPVCKVLAILTFCCFSTIHWVTLWRGKTISCGCFGAESEPISVRSATYVTLATILFALTCKGANTDKLDNSH